MDIKGRIKEFAEFKKISIREFERRIGASNGYVNSLKEDMGGRKVEAALQAFPELNRIWLLTGEGEMTADNGVPLSDERQDEDFGEEKFYTYKLPIAAVGGSLDGWGATEPIMPWQCDRVVSPVKGVDLAVPVVGDSMAPDYPNGSMVYVKRINPASFIHWGQVFVLDTENGSILKEVQPCDEDDSCVECRSLNPDKRYRPFKVPKTSIRGMYRVVASMSLR